MNQPRRSLLVAGAISAIGFMAGCATSALFKPHEYVEPISAVLLTADGRQLAVLSENYHYIFDAPETVTSTLRSEFRQYVEATFQTFFVDASGRVSGEYELRISRSAPDNQKTSAIAAGFKATSRGDAVFSGELSGTRYSANGIQPTSTTQRLNKEYKIYVHAPQSTGEKAAKMLLTPITVAVDGVLVIAAIPLFAVSVGVLAFLCRDHGCR